MLTINISPTDQMLLDDPKGRTYLLLSEMKYYLSTSFVRNFMFLANETSIKYAF